MTKKAEEVANLKPERLQSYAANPKCIRAKLLS